MLWTREAQPKESTTTFKPISLSIRVQTTLNNIRFVFTTRSTSNNSFFSFKSVALTHLGEQRCLDSY